MNTLASIVGFAVGAALLAICGLQSQPEAVGFFITISGGYLLGSWTK
jgi:hypothetical protein